ncbi:MAG: tetratricopeptide repeat protein [Candidatus Thorarchaeota archaeon]
MEIKSFPDAVPEVLKNAERLMYEAKFEKALELIEDFEKKDNINPKDQLTGHIIKGMIYCYTEKYKQAVEIGEFAFELSQQLQDIYHSIDALIIEAHMVYLGNTERAFNTIVKAGNLIESIENYPPLGLSRQHASFLLLKSIIYHHKGDLNEAEKLARDCLLILEKSGEKLDLARIYFHLGELILFGTDPDMGLEYRMKSLALHEELNNEIGIAHSRYLTGTGFYVKGDFDHALKLVKQNLALKKISILGKIESFDLLGAIYMNKGELERALRYRKRAFKLAEKEDYNEQIIQLTYGIGNILRTMGELDEAMNYFKRGLELSEKYDIHYGIMSSLFHLIRVNIEKNSLYQAKIYLTQLEQISKKTESTVFKNQFVIAKALVLKNSSRIRNRAEAELLLKQILEQGVENPLQYKMTVINLCELFLEELHITNNTEVLDELIPLISRMSDIAENQNAYSWLAETKLLQAKLAQVQLNFDKSMLLLTQAQRIAEFHGLNLLAFKISSEHDNLLDHLNEWDSLKSSNAPISERMKLVSFEGVVDRMQGKRALEPPNLIPEIPGLLLIIGEGGFPLFSNLFSEKYGLDEDLISVFLSAVNSFSDEMFSKGLDRAKFGDHTLLMQPINGFSVCYLFKGQTFYAKQKLTRFIESIRNIKSIWEALNKFYEANQIIEFKDLPSLELLISEIFVQ